jgi:hypothetical protein
MSNLTKYVAVLMIAGTSVAMADVSLNFKHTSLVRDTAGSGTTITFDFSVNGSGGVTLDASTTSVLANIINSVNSWDGGVGTVTDTSLFGTTFQILMSSSSVVTPNRSFTMDGRYSTGMIGVSGNNSSRIDGQTSSPTPDDMESLTFTLTSGSPLITLKSFNWDFASTAASLADAKLLDGDTSVTYLDMTAAFTGSPSTYGTKDTSAAGLTLGSGANALVFTSPATIDGGTHGYGLSGMTLQIAAVPEPTTTGLLGLGVIGILLSPRFKSRA